MPVLVVWAMLLAAALPLRADDDRRTLTVELPDGGQQEIQVTLDQLREALQNWEPSLFTRSYDVGMLLRETPAAPRWFVDEGVRAGVDPRAAVGGMAIPMTMMIVIDRVRIFYETSSCVMLKTPRNHGRDLGGEPPLSSTPTLAACSSMALSLCTEGSRSSLPRI